MSMARRCVILPFPGGAFPQGYSKGRNAYLIRVWDSVPATEFAKEQLRYVKQKPLSPNCHIPMSISCVKIQTISKKTLFPEVKGSEG